MLNPRRNSGFTLVELLITVVIVAVLAALAAPSFTAIVVNTRIKGAAQALTDGLQLARAEAIRRNERVRLVLAASSGWSVITNSGATLQTRPAAESGENISLTYTPNDATSVTFNASGRVVANADASATLTQIEIDVPTTVLPASSTKELRVTISSGGMIRLCDPNVGSGDPRSC